MKSLRLDRRIPYLAVPFMLLGCGASASGPDEPRAQTESELLTALAPSSDAWIDSVEGVLSGGVVSSQLFELIDEATPDDGTSFVRTKAGTGSANYTAGFPALDAGTTLTSVSVSYRAN